ncbi:MAG: GAF domain-containing protein [Actinophytocola sp.]|uniref:GAF domain-containing sensor histidine kinase n=1 Tax=Actinophytocola sp. TaxID=1872138 RepID=UPI00132A403F|nr:GAF domain-containing sensor histidine kinase [Actinophytocola sp.]MPZ81729.1 GAF domain-containing protein [Actinophytocola sp.]
MDEFVYNGIDQEDAARIGHLPRGQGILGLLITEPHPMRSFLGVPILIRGQAFGNLYLTDKQDADEPSPEFTDEDIQLVRSLAGFAAVAIDNARLYAEAERRAAWQRASVDITAALLAGSDTDDVLRLVAEQAHTVANADLAAVILQTDEPGTLDVHAAVGEGAGDVLGQKLPADGSLCELAMTIAQPLLSDNIGKDERGRTPGTAWAANLGPGMIAPLGQPPTGVLLVANKPGRHCFHQRDLKMLAAFASQAALAQQLAEHRTYTQELRLLEDRDRIGRVLHDHVIQELFATGMSLHSIASTAATDQQHRLMNAVRKLDQVVRDIRETIFDLHNQSAPGEQALPSLRRTLTEITRETTHPLGFTPALRLDGPLDTFVPGAVAADLTAVVREALSNTARHAHATTATVQITATPNTLTARIEDDGRGMGDTTRRSGLANLRARAEKHGGTFIIDSTLGHGTTLTWTVPLPNPTTDT